jgi:hypothetical protein
MLIDGNRVRSLFDERPSDRSRKTKRSNTIRRQSENPINARTSYARYLTLARTVTQAGDTSEAEGY